jgi:hypothetical protein
MNTQQDDCVVRQQIQMVLDWLIGSLFIGYRSLKFQIDQLVPRHLNLNLIPLRAMRDSECSQRTWMTFEIRHIVWVLESDTQRHGANQSIIHKLPSSSNARREGSMPAARNEARSSRWNETEHRPEQHHSNKRPDRSILEHQFLSINKDTSQPC